MATPQIETTPDAILTALQRHVVFAGASPNGSWLESIDFQAKPGANNTASVGRAYLKRTANAPPQDMGEVTLTATTASAISAVAKYTLTIQKAIPAGATVLVELGTTVASGYHVIAYGETLDGQSVYAAAYIT